MSADLPGLKLRSKPISQPGSCNEPNGSESAAETISEHIYPMGSLTFAPTSRQFGFGKCHSGHLEQQLYDAGRGIYHINHHTSPVFQHHYNEKGNHSGPTHFESAKELQRLCLRNSQYTEENSRWSGNGGSSVSLGGYVAIWRKVLLRRLLAQRSIPVDRIALRLWLSKGKNIGEITRT